MLRLQTVFLAALLASASFVYAQSVQWSAASNPSSGLDNIASMAMDSTYLYFVGHDSVGGVSSNPEWRIEKRSRSTGTLSWAMTSNPSASYDYAKDIAIDSTYMYVVGADMASGNNNYRFRIEKRRISNGALVWAVAEDISSGFSWGSDMLNGIAIDSAYMYVVGTDTLGSLEWRMEKRRLSDGGLVWTQVSNPSNLGWEQAYDVAIDSTYMYVVGYDYAPGNDEWRIEKRRLSTGALEWAVQSNPTSSSGESARGIAIDSTYMYVVGSDAANNAWRIEKRRLSDGSLVWYVTDNPTGYVETAAKVALDSSYMYIVGEQHSGSGLDRLWRITKRRISDGSLVWSDAFNPSSGYDSATSIAIDTAHMYVGGGTNNAGNVDGSWLIQKRALEDQMPPSFISVSDSPDPVNGGDVITVSSVSSDPNTLGLVKLYVCKATDGASSGCVGGEWCSSGFVNSNPSCSFIAPMTNAVNNYYAYVFDDSSLGASTNAMAGDFTTNSFYDAQFSQQGVSGVPWGIVVDGKAYNSSSSALAVLGLSGTAAYSYNSTIESGGTRYVCTVNCSGTVSSSSTTANSSYKTQHSFTILGNPVGGGTTSPPEGAYWHDSGSFVSLFATPSPGYNFSSWNGAGVGSYSGSANPSGITISSPITETALFEDLIWKECGKITPTDQSVLRTPSGKEIEVELEINATICPLFNYELFLKKTPPENWGHRFDCAFCVSGGGKTAIVPSSQISSPKKMKLTFKIPTYASPGAYRIIISGRKV